MSALSLGWRSIWRNRRRTLISMSAVGVGLLLVVVYGGLISGIIGDAKNQLDNTGMGHVEIYADGWRPKQAPAATLKRPAELLAALPLPPGAQVGARVVTRALATSARGSSGVQVLGVDFADEPKLSAHLVKLKEGIAPAPDDLHGLVLGDALAARLQVTVGGRVRLMAQRADGEMGADLYRVRGIYHSISQALSKKNVYVTAKAAQELLGLGDEAHQVVVQLEDASQAGAAAAAIRGKLGAGHEVVTYGQLLPMLKMMEDLTDNVMLLAALFVYFLVGLGILNTILMSVMERTREFGVMLAVGTRPRRLVSQVLAESFWIATVSVAVGLSLGLFITWWGQDHPLLTIHGVGEAMDLGGTALKTEIYTRLSVPQALRAGAFVYLMALVVGLFPASRVARLHPSEALRRA